MKTIMTQIVEGLTNADDAKVEALIKEWLETETQRKLAELNESDEQSEEENLEESSEESGDEEELTEESEESEDLTESEEEEEETDELTESFKEWKSSANAEGQEVGDGGKVIVNDKSPVADLPFPEEDIPGPVVIKDKPNKSHKLETAPKAKSGPAADNNKGKGFKEVK